MKRIIDEVEAILQSNAYWNPPTESLESRLDRAEAILRMSDSELNEMINRTAEELRKVGRNGH